MEWMHAAALRFELWVPDSRSLKTKRAALGVAAVADHPARLDEVLDTVERFVRRAGSVEVLDVERAELASPDAGLGEW